MTGIRHIMAAVDLSTDSPLALARAASLATSYGARLTVLHASKAAFDTSRRNALQARLADLAGAHAFRPHADMVVLPGDPAPTILDFARADGVDLIVVGRRRHGMFQRLFFESAGEIVTREASCPVLAVTEPRATPPVTPRSRRRPRILCAVDLTESSAPTLDRAASLAHNTRAPLTVLHVIENWYWPEARATGHDEVSALRGRMAGAAYQGLDRLLSAWPEIEAEPLVSFGVPPLEIVRAAATVGAETLVLGAHSTRVLGHTLLGSTCRYVLAEPPCAILLARPAQRASRQPASEPALTLVPRPR
jgi:universal stress protein E